MIRGEWTIHLAPQYDESLTSWLARTAFAHGITPYRFTNYWTHGCPVWERDIDRSATDALLTTLSHHAGLDEPTLERMTLRGIEQQLVKHYCQGNARLLLACGIYHRTRTLHGLQYCPICFREQGVFFTRHWRLSFMVVCPEHGHVLQDACPHCDGSLMPHRSTALRMDRCAVCEASLLSLGTHPTQVPDAVAALQHQLLDTLDGSMNTAFLQSPGCLETFAVVRTLLGILANERLHNQLRYQLGLTPTVSFPTKKNVFENQRIPLRLATLESLAHWLRDWPDTFLENARLLGLTKRTFIRCNVPDFFAREIESLPKGQRRQRKKASHPAKGKPLSGLRRGDPVRYRQEKARYLLDLAGYPNS
nr:TniQ family protein [uncultured Halomonas sp.]